MSGASQFFDTNVVLYLLSDDAGKADRAEALMAEGGVISVQVLNEFASVAKRKFAMTWPEITEFLSTVRQVCEVQPLTLETHDRALAIADRFGFSFYDSLVVAAAQIANCSLLYSEDMQDGQTVGGVMIRNPFGTFPRS